jgi:glycerol-3-phosphate acyltransferase PlsY
MSELLSSFSWPLLLIAAYIVGSIPAPQILARLNGVDLRKVGSGNIGAGNLTKSVGVSWGIVAAIFDGLKGLVPVLISRYALNLGLGASGIAGLAAVVGHNWSIFMRGRSGRGLASSAGLLVGLDPVLIVWVGGWSLAGWRIGSGLAGFFGWVLLPLTALALGRPGPEILFYTLLAAVLVSRRMQGNADAPSGVNNALRRALYDCDPMPEEYGTTADEASRS